MTDFQLLAPLSPFLVLICVLLAHAGPSFNRKPGTNRDLLFFRTPVTPAPHSVIQGFKNLWDAERFSRAEQILVQKSSA